MHGNSHGGSVRPYDSSSVEQIRILATVLLVTYHVIGVPTSGLQIGHSHPLRIFADVLGDFRMPAFAFVAGFVYALRPVRAGESGSFVVRKLRRLAIPGLIAILVFNGVSTLLDLHWATQTGSMWQLLILPYAHFWFLQALLTILVVVGLIDAGTQGRAEVPLLVCALALSLVPLPWPGVFSLNQAVKLAPFFLAGMCYWRHRDWISGHARIVATAATVAIAAWCLLTLAQYYATGAIQPGHRQFQALLLGVPICTLLLFRPLPVTVPRRLGEYTFTIYLYHVLATSGMRRALMAVGVQSLAVHVLLGVAAGLLLPVALHRALLGWRMGAQFVLGIRRPAVAPPVLQPAPWPRPIASGVPAEARR
jgi:fucose 4-O-acetylase-like acetyltransferase